MKSTSARWFSEPKFEVHNTLVSVFTTVRDECEWRVDADEYHAGLYCSSDKPGIRSLSRRGYEYGPATLPYNVCRSAVDTLTAKIAKHRPLPQVLTQRGHWKNQKRAKKMTQFLEGEFYRQRIYEVHAKKIVRDALIFGRGILKIWTEGERIQCERTHPWEVFADEWDARYGDPQNLFQCRSLDKNVALERFARTESGGWKSKVRDAIESAGQLDLGSRNYAMMDQSSTVDRIDIVEAWHLPSAPGAGDGRHVVVCQGATLVDEEWTLDYFPFAILSYNDAISGYWGHGLVEQLEGYQFEINLSSEKLSEQYAMSGKLILVPDGAGIHDQQIRNGITTVFHKNGATPQVFDMDLVNEHLRVRPRELTQDGLNDAGISQMSAQSEKPAGITAGIALQTLDDIETERFMVFGRAYESWNLDVARMFIDCAKAIAAEHGDMAVSVPMKGGLIDLKWTDVYVDGVEIRVFPTSLLPQQLSARLEKLKDMWNTGLIDRSTFLRQLDAPDMQAELDLETADKLVIDEMLDAMADADDAEKTEEEAFMPPSAEQDLAWGVKRCQQKLNRGILDGMPEFNQMLLRRWISEGKQELDKLAPAPPPANDMTPPAAAAPPAPDMAQLGIPGAPPPGMAA